MPIYEYECTACHNKLEVIQKFSDEALIICPTCGKSSLKKLISTPMFKFKGTGWYETDLKSKSKPNAKKQEDSASPNTANTETKTSSAEKPKENN